MDVANFSLPQYAYALTFDRVGNVKSAAEQTQNTSWTWQYSYDSLNRLIAATSPELALGCSETYDAYGNRTSQAAYGSGNSCISNSMSFTGNNNRIDMGSYDASGNLLQDPPSVAVRHTYTYDAEGRLSSVDGATTYVYGADGVRVAAISASGTTNYLSDFDGSLLARYVNGSANGQPQEIWVKGQHRAIVSQSGTLASIDITSTLTDWLGNIRVNDDFSGQVRSSFRYLPFGNLITLVPDSETSPLLFTAKQRDQESGNDYFGARYYSSATGRFTSPDPGWVLATDPSNPQTWNLYSYALNNPLKFTDPTGEYCFYGDISSEPSDGSPSDYDFASSPNECSRTGGLWRNDAQATITVNAGGSNTADFIFTGAPQNGSTIPTLNVQSFIDNTAAPKRVLNKITCGTVLPNGRTVGSYVNQLSNSINGAAGNPVSTPYGPGPNPSAPGPISVASQVYSGTNFRGMFGKGAGYTANAFYGDAGNFAYAAVSANIGVPYLATELAAAGYSWTHHPPSDWVGPYGMDPSATAQIPAGYGASCKGF